MSVKPHFTPSALQAVSTVGFGRVPTKALRGLLLLAAVSLGLRVGVVLALASLDRVPFTYEHGEIAENLLAGKGFSVTFLGVEGPTSQQAPLYPMLLAAMYWLFGAGSAAAILTMQLLQAVAGTALVLCVAWLAWSLFPERPMMGWLAGWGAALFPTHIYMVTHVQVAPWAALLLTLLTALVLSSLWQRHAWCPVLAGVLSGLLLLLEPILALALPVLALAALARSRSGSRETSGIGILTNSATRLFSTDGLWRAVLMAVVTCLVIAPWLWRNYRVHGELVFIKSTFGYAFWQGNNPASWGTDKVPKASADEILQQHDGSLAGIERAMWEARHETIYIDDLLLKPDGYRQFAGLSEPQRSRLLQTQAMQFIRENPQRYLQLCLQRLRYFLLWDETNPKAANLVYRGTTLVWLALCIAGLWTCRRDWRRLWPTLAIVAVIALFHSLTIVSARFRIPVEPLTFVWCAAALVGQPSRLSGGKRDVTLRELA